MILKISPKNKTEKENLNGINSDKSLLPRIRFVLFTVTHSNICFAQL